jgi:hypothetical protein
MIAQVKPFREYTGIDWSRVEIAAPKDECLCGMPLIGDEQFCPECLPLVRRAQIGDFPAFIRLQRILAGA